MERMTSREITRDAQRVKTNKEELIERIGRTVSEDGAKEVFPGFFLARSARPSESLNAVYRPAFCLVAQGRKRALLGEEVFRYDPGHYLLFTVDLPLIFQIEKATQDEPYLGLRLDLDPSLVASVLMEANIKIKKGDASTKAMDVQSIDANLIDAIVRLVRLADEPGSSNILAPLIVKEIIYRLLSGGQGARLGHLLPSGDTQRISRAIGHLREHFDEPLKIDEFARQFGMSVSGFHHHFKSVTAMSPLQFQKQIRLQEARRLMLGEDLDAASAGFRVGYEDPSYFSRDYKKQFGAPPQRDVTRLRSNLGA
ncbi:MAG TPA: AraC family transcriptional regulator [Pyrinomonadaceae bacterium]|nr:AraC family transcriptional regulator [Pyrinomonadaceae bacterium]